MRRNPSIVRPIIVKLVPEYFRHSFIEFTTIDHYLNVLRTIIGLLYWAESCRELEGAEAEAGWDSGSDLRNHHYG